MTIKNTMSGSHPCPRCWSPLFPEQYSNRFTCTNEKCRVEVTYELLLHSEAAVWVHDQTRNHSALVPFSDLKLTGKEKGQVLVGPHKGLNWERWKL